MIKSIKFLTSSKYKFTEASSILLGFNVIQEELDLEEIQSIEIEPVIRKKVEDAKNRINGEFFCEDTGLFIEEINGFPGALTKFYIEKLGVAKIAEFHGGSRAYCKTSIAYYDGKNTHFFTGISNGKISSFTLGEGFGFTQIFIPEIDGINNQRSFAELTRAEKNTFSQRAKALRLLVKHLEKS